MLTKQKKSSIIAKNILKINGFVYDYQLQGYIDNRGYGIFKKDGEYIISNGGYNLEKYCKNIEEVIGILVLKGIIYRLI